MIPPAKDRALSERAERLKTAIGDVRNAGFTDAEESQEIARAIVSESGITPEMVEDLQSEAELAPSFELCELLNGVADALSALLEVAGADDSDSKGRDE